MTPSATDTLPAVPTADGVVDLAAATSTDDPPLRLSFSQIDAYRNCPSRWAFRYVKKLPSAPSPTLSYGTSLHAAIEHWYNQKLDIDGAPPVEVLLDGLRDNWESDGFVDETRDEQIRWYRQAQQVLRNLHARLAPSFRMPVASEEWFELPFDNGRVVLVGSIDHVEPTSPGRFGIVDWKSSKKAKARKYVEKSLQLAIYAYAARALWGTLPDWVALDFIVPGVRVDVPLAKIDVAGVEDAVMEVVAGIRDERHDATPNRLCDWCDFRALCPEFEGDGPDVRGVAIVELQRLERRMARDAARHEELVHIVSDPGMAAANPAA